MRFAGFRLATLLTIGLLSPAGKLAAQGNPIDDVIKLAIDAWNDLKYPTADSIARRVLTMSSASPAQRLRAQMVMIAAAYPEEKTDQKRTVAMATIKQVLRANYDAKMPSELSWPGLDSLFDEARKTTFGMQLSGEASQATTGPDGTAKLHVKSNKPGLFRLVITSKANGSAVVVDSVRGTSEADITFKTMRDEKPIFSSGDYNVLVTAFEPGAKGDTVTTQYALKATAPALTFAAIPTKQDSTKRLRERTGKFGMRAFFPALLVGGAAYYASTQLHGEGGLATGQTDSKGPDAAGTGVAGGLALVTLIAGFADHGRAIPENIAANKAANEAFQKSIADAQAENRRRVTEYKTVLTFDFGGHP